jgi:heme-degrading monooxygenase HmoA
MIGAARKGARVPTVYTTGSWRPKEGHEAAFLEAWTVFARWASEMVGAGTVRLARDLRDSGRFVSFAARDGIGSVRAWKGSDEFKPRMAVVQQHVAEFEPTELELVRSIEAAVEARA